jgi:hypothetical protein
MSFEFLSSNALEVRCNEHTRMVQAVVEFERSLDSRLKHAGMTE